MIDLPENNPNGDSTPADITAEAPQKSERSPFCSVPACCRPSSRIQAQTAQGALFQGAGPSGSLERRTLSGGIVFHLWLWCARSLHRRYPSLPRGHGCPILGRMPLRGYRLRSWGRYSWPSRLYLFSSDSLPFHIDSPTGPDLLRRQFMKSNVTPWEDQ